MNELYSFLLLVVSPPPPPLPMVFIIVIVIDGIEYGALCIDIVAGLQISFNSMTQASCIHHACAVVRTTRASSPEKTDVVESSSA